MEILWWKGDGGEAKQGPWGGKGTERGGEVGLSQAAVGRGRSRRGVTGLTADDDNKGRRSPSRVETVRLA